MAAMSRMPGGQSRWSAGKDLSWEPLRIERVCEVKYDHLQGDRFRHATIFLRWRPDKRPDDCRYDQLDVTTPYELEKVFGGRDAAVFSEVRVPAAGFGPGASLLRSTATRRRDRDSLRVEGFLRGPPFNRDVLQVHTDAGPGLKATAHGVNEHIGRLEMRGNLRMASFPALEPGEGSPPSPAPRPISISGCFDARAGGTAGRARARLSASCNAAATAHRRDRRARAARTARADHPASRDAGRCPHAGHQSSRTARASSST